MATRDSGWTQGFTIFAGMMLILVGAFHAFTGLAAIAEDEFFVVGADYVYEFDVTLWGWLHVIFGLVVVAAGLGIFREATWARMFGIIIAAISAIGNFFFIPYQPVWALLMIALDVLVIAALSARVPTSSRMGA